MSPLLRTKDEEIAQRPRSAPSDSGLKEGGGGAELPRLSDALSSLPRLHIQQLHTRLPVFKNLSLSPDANDDDVSSQVPPPPLPLRFDV